MNDFTVIVLGLASFLVGLLQMYQRAISSKGQLQETKNDEILEAERAEMKAQIAVQLCETQRDMAELKYLKEQNKYRRLVQAVKKECDPETLEKIKKRMQNIP